MEKTRKFQAGDKVECIDIEMTSLQKEKTFVVSELRDDISKPTIYLVGDNNGKCGYYEDRFRLVKPANHHKVGTIFSALNAKEAELYIGRMVEFIDNIGFRKNQSWTKGVFENFTSLEESYPFRMKDGEYYHLIRLIKESFEAPKSKVDPKLIEALKLSVKQWQIMYDTGKSKESTYRFLGGEMNNSCFLCNFIGVGSGGNINSCRKCIDWKADFCHSDGDSKSEGGSPYEKYRDDEKSKSAILGVLDHLKSELTRLESESK